MCSNWAPYRRGEALAVDDVAGEGRLVKHHVAAGAVLDLVQELPADELGRGDGGAVGELDARVWAEGGREVPFAVLDAVLAEEEDVVFCPGCAIVLIWEALC